MKEAVDLKTYFLMRYANFSTLYGISGFSGAVVAAKGLPNIWVSFVAFTAPWLGGLATLLLNDYFDRKVDRHIRPWRPLVSGKMKAEYILAPAFVAIGFGFFLTISLFNFACLLVALIVASSVFTYNISKKKRYIAHMILATSTALGPVYGYAAVNEITLETFPLVLVMGLMIFLDGLSLALLASIPDAAGDKIGGVVTASVKFGGMKVVQVGFSLLTLNVILGFLPFILGYLNIVYVLCYLSTRLALAGMYAAFIKNPDQKFSYAVANVQGFTRKGLFLAFPLGVLPIDLGMALAPILCLLILTTTLGFYTSSMGLKY